MDTAVQKQTHTPGPWHESRRTHSMNYDIYTSDGNGYALVHIVHDERTPTAEEHAANARLIAAAPDLLAALEMVRESEMEITPIGNTIYRLSPAQRKQLTAAIEKARG